jgi:hypothetical protein
MRRIFQPDTSSQRQFLVTPSTAGTLYYHSGFPAGQYTGRKGTFIVNGQLSKVKTSFPGFAGYQFRQYLRMESHFRSLGTGGFQCSAVTGGYSINRVI